MALWCKEKQAEDYFSNKEKITVAKSEDSASILKCYRHVVCEGARHGRCTLNATEIGSNTEVSSRGKYRAYARLLEASQSHKNGAYLDRRDHVVSVGSTITVWAHAV